VAAAFNGLVFTGSIAAADKPAGCHHSFEADESGGYKWKQGTYSWHTTISATDSEPNELAAPVCAQVATNELCGADGDFVRGTKGNGTCPSGTSAIDTPEECAGAAKRLGLIPAGSALSGANAGLTYQEAQSSAGPFSYSLNVSPHPGCSYNADRAAGTNNENDKIINFNSNLSPIADLSFAVEPLCRCDIPARTAAVVPLSSASSAPGGTAATKKTNNNSQTIVIVIGLLVCVAGVGVGVVWYRKRKEGEITGMNAAFSML